MAMFNEAKWTWDAELANSWSVTHPPQLPGFRSPMEFILYYQSAWLQASALGTQPPPALLAAFPYVMRRYHEERKWYPCAFLLLIVAAEARGSNPQPVTSMWLWNRATRFAKRFDALHQAASRASPAGARGVATSNRRFARGQGNRTSSSSANANSNRSRSTPN